MKQSYPEIITSTVPIFFLVYSPDRKEICYISDNFFNLVAGSNQSQKSDNTTFWNYILKEDRAKLKDFLNDLSIENNFTGREEIRAKVEGEKIRKLELSMYPMEDSYLDDEMPQLLAGQMRDITSQKEQEKKARQLLNSKNNIINILSHDLRTPFHQISSIIHLLKSQMNEEERKKFSKYLKLLAKIGRNSDGLIDRLTDIAQIQAYSKDPNFQLHDLRKLVQENVEEHLQEKGIGPGRIKTELPDYAAEAEVDPVLFKQIFTNLISNALKFTPDDKLIRISVYSRKNKDMVVEVKDEGQGIPKPKLDKLFSEPTAVRRKGLKGEKSVGLGLQITKQLVELHKGKLEVKSSEGKGSIFSVCIPLPELSYKKGKDIHQNHAGEH